MADGIKSDDMTGQCIICGRRMIIVISRGNNRFPSIFLCPECDKKLRFLEAKAFVEAIKPHDDGK